MVSIKWSLFEVRDEVGSEPLVSEPEVVEGRGEEMETSGGIEMLEAEEVLGREGGREGGREEGKEGGKEGGREGEREKEERIV